MTLIKYSRSNGACQSSPEEWLLDVIHSRGLNSYVKLTGALNLKPGEVISLVGGGGKTTIMFALAREISSSGGTVITTTTTKILEPSPRQSPFLILDTDEVEILKQVSQYIRKYKHVTVASKKIEPGKIKGISPEMVILLAAQNPTSCIINEADGAAQRPLKAPNATEPIIPSNTSLVIAVVGADAIGCRLTEEKVLRSEIAARLLGLPLGSVITSDEIAVLLTCPQGIIKGSPPQARIIPFINKLDSKETIIKGRELAKKVISRKHPQINQVILGQAQSDEPVIEVISEEN